MIAPKTILFTDLRHIQCGHLEWVSPEGERLPLIRPPEPPVEARSAPRMVAHGVKLVAQPARKSEPLPPGTPASLNRVLLEDGLYRSWRMVVDYPPGQNLGAYSTAHPQSVAICHAESEEGFEWRETARCPLEVPGQTRFDGFGLMVDPHGPPEERYKAVYMAHPPEEEGPALWRKFQRIHPRHRDLRLRKDYLSCMYGAVSPDGLHWEPIREPLMVHKSDTLTTVYYDSWLERYVMYTRLYDQDRRWVGRAEARDFRRWGPVEPLLWPGLGESFSYDIYTNGRTEYPGSPEYHLMFPMFYQRATEASEVRLFSSADGLCWNPVPGGPVLSPGAPGEWDGEFIAAGNGLVPWGEDRVGLLYAGTRFPHKYPRWDEVLQAGRIAWAWWPKGRLCAVVAEEEGEFFTFPLTPAGRELRLNARVRRGGEVRVGLAGRPGRTAAEGDPIFGDSLAHPVHWKGQADHGVPEGDRVILHFRLRAAEVFGLEWV